MHRFSLALRLYVGIVLLTSLVLPAVSQTTGNFVVFSSTNIEAWPPGQQLKPGQKLKLAKEDVLEAIDSASRKIVLRGPGERIVPTASQQTRQLGLLASLLAARQEIMRAFVMRQGELPTSPQVEWVDLTTDGNKCVRTGMLPMLWQPPHPAAAVQARISLADRGTWITWPSGAEVVAWPASLPFVPGGRYRVELPAINEINNFSLVMVDDPPADPVLGGTLLLKLNCTEQALALLHRAPLSTGERM